MLKKIPFWPRSTNTGKPKTEILIHRIIDYGINVSEIVVFQKMIEHLQLSDLEQQYCEVTLMCSDSMVNSNHILVRVNTGGSNNNRDWQFRVLPTAINSYYEYQELQEARANAIAAHRFSIVALIISLISLAISIVEAFEKAKSLKIPDLSL